MKIHSILSISSQEYKQCFGIYFPDFFCKLQTIHLRHFNVKYIQE